MSEFEKDFPCFNFVFENSRNIDERYSGMLYTSPGFRHFVALYDDSTGREFMPVLPVENEEKAWELACFWVKTFGALVPVK